MAVCTVFKNPNPRTNAAVPYLLDVQSELFSELGTRLVVPLYRAEAAGVQAISRLTPVMRFQGASLVAMVPELAGIPRRELGVPCGDLPDARNEVLRAIDLLLAGF
ncbi:CcdB family protein [Geothrix alkalitolerans]|uniref:CcdB family protein n=1 Tax=Geothrix alkalitolerans TaxID=2922724 RepID=UPI001FAFBA96|nr:CcdB family protein [Geothrix alkalitolerans]